MLKRPEGATIKQVCEATEWQAHTVRGTFAVRRGIGRRGGSDRVVEPGPDS